MKMFIKVLIVILLIMPIFMFGAFASSSETDEVPIELADGSGYLTHICSDEYVTIPKEYKMPDTSFRAVWVSSFVGDISTFTSIDAYKKEILSMLDVCDVYGINTVIFHVRVANDAFYKSKYCKWSKYYNTNPSWDALPWVIEECHKRGVEFHAWLNPYRVSTSSEPVSEVAKRFQSNNPASNPDNLLQGSDTVIMNPGEPIVRNFLKNVVMELIENYNVDGIHFDDYFYASGIDDSLTLLKYNDSGMSAGDFRRQQVNLLIESLSKSIREFNKETGRRVQFGISPSGSWKSAGEKSYVEYDKDGNAISNGEASFAGFTDFGDYLYADTLTWTNNEWIDYILPQTYLSLENRSSGYVECLDWWNKVLKYKNVNLYAAMGLYMRDEADRDSWTTSNYEAYNEIMYANKLENCYGMSVYCFQDLKASITNKKGFYKVDRVWNNTPILPEIRTNERISVDPISSLEINKIDKYYHLSFDKVDNAKFYVVYRSENDITYAPEEVIDIIGGTSNHFDYIDKEADINKDYNYAIRCQSNSLTLSSGVANSTKSSKSGEKISLGEIGEIKVSGVLLENTVVTLSWQSLYNQFGSSPSYEIYYSSDNKNYEKISSPISTPNMEGYQSVKYTLPLNKDKAYFKVIASNEIGESVSNIKEIDVKKSFGEIRNFIFQGETFTNQKVGFVFNNILDLENVSYTLQMSKDNIEFSDVLTNESSLDTNNLFKVTLPGEVGKYYYRVKGEYSNMLSYSETLTIDVTNNFGEITGLKVDGEDLKEFYVLNEDDTIVVSFDYKTNDKDPINYVSRLSLDNNNWMMPSSMSQKNKWETKNGKATQTILMTGTVYKYYYKLEVNTSKSKSKTSTFMIYSLNNDMFVDEFSAFMKQEQKYLLDRIDIFN